MMSHYTSFIIRKTFLKFYDLSPNLSIYFELYNPAILKHQNEFMASRRKILVSESNERNWQQKAYRFLDDVPAVGL